MYPTKHYRKPHTEMVNAGFPRKPFISHTETLLQFKTNRFIHVILELKIQEGNNNLVIKDLWSNLQTDLLLINKKCGLR